MTARLDPPAHYDDERRQIWAETVTRLTSSGRVFRADPEVLGTYVEAVRSHRQASRLLAQTNVMITRDGIAMENPALAIQRKSAEAMARASRSLGLDRIPADPIADEPPGAPIAAPARRRWCEEHKRHECRHKRQDGTPCHQYRLVAGLDVCRKHGGKTIGELRADGRTAALEAQAARELAHLDVPPVTDPLTELARLAGQAVAWKDSMAAKVNELTSLRYESFGGGEQLRAEIALWERSLDRCISTLGAMARLNIEDRLAGVREATARMLEEALTAALQKSGADIGGQAAAREEFKRRLRVVA
jgi:P27 family predicted phage terminase small subunit